MERLLRERCEWVIVCEHAGHHDGFMTIVDLERRSPIANNKSQRLVSTA